MADKQRGGSDETRESGIQASGGGDRGESGRLRKELGSIGRGMSSLDSTQVPLSAETGEPDERTFGEGARRQRRDENDQSSGR